MAMPSVDVDCLPAFCGKRTLILGCGNLLFGDDGFGPAVIDHLSRRYRVPDDVYVMDAGTGVRKLLFTLLLSPQHPREIFIVDAADKGRAPGEVFELPLGSLPPEKIDDFSLHQVPTSNLARELRDAGVQVRVILCQPGPLPGAVSPGLSEPVSGAVASAAALIAGESGLNPW